MTIQSKLAAAAAVATLAIAAPAGAATLVTFNLGGAPDATAQTFTYPGSPSGNVSLTLGGWTYSIGASGLNGHTIGDSSFAVANIFRDSTGVGVCAVTSPADNCTTVDTTPNGNGGNESLALNFSQLVTLQSITVSGFQSTATLALWRADPSTSTLTTAYTNGALGTTSPLTINLASLNLNASTFALTNTGNNDLGYHVNQIVVSIADTGPVPEPATWTMMILGFGGVGALIRRRRPAPALVRVTA